MKRSWATVQYNQKYVGGLKLADDLVPSRAGLIQAGDLEYGGSLSTDIA
jgi:hypothetical protein